MRVRLRRFIIIIITYNFFFLVVETYTLKILSLVISSRTFYNESRLETERGKGEGAREIMQYHRVYP